jgi:hypothetical protein
MFKNATFLSFYLADNQLFSNSETLVIISISMEVQEIFEGFQILKIPRENIPLGAEWVIGIGINGNNFPETNISISRAINSYEIEKTVKQSIDISTLSFFNLDGTYLNRSTKQP